MKAQEMVTLEALQRKKHLLMYELLNAKAAQNILSTEVKKKLSENLRFPTHSSIFFQRSLDSHIPLELSCYKLKKKNSKIDNFCKKNSQKNLQSVKLVMPASVAIGTIVSMLSRQSLQHKTKACHTRRRNNQRTFWMTFNPSRKEGSWEVVKILTDSHDKFNNNGGNNQHSIRTRAKPPRPPNIRGMGYPEGLALFLWCMLHNASSRTVNFLRP